MTFLFSRPVTLALALGGLVGAALPAVAQAPSGPAAKAIAAPTPPPPPSPLAQAFDIAANAALSKAVQSANGRIDLLIDPLVDGNSGAQTVATRSMEADLKRLIAARYADKFDVKPFNAANVAGEPFVFIGTFTPIKAVPKSEGPNDAYRVCFAIIDLKSRKIVSKGFARATPQGINHTPTSAFADAPVWVQDPAITGYVKTCQGTKAGDPINPVYVERIQVASLISEAISAYDSKRLDTALDLYTKAKALAGGDQLRVHNGIYLANLKLNRTTEAQKAFSELVDFGLKSEKLAVMMLFRPGTTNFVPGAISMQYPSWLKTIAERASAQRACLELVGHASHTGQLAYNDRLSQRRADFIKSRLQVHAPQVGKTIATKGLGWRENIVGTGKDDASDALDRRVEFKVSKC